MIGQTWTFPPFGVEQKSFLENLGIVSNWTEVRYFYENRGRISVVGIFLESFF